MKTAERQRNLAEEALTRVETERLEAIRERDEARALARALWREEYLGDEAPEWLTVDGPEDIAQRERQQQMDIAHVNALFAHLTTNPPAREAGEEGEG